MEEIPKTIDIGQAIRNGNSTFLRSLPRFFIRLMERIIHQDSMNETIYRNRDKQGIEFVDAVLEEWNMDVVINGEENVPKSGRFVFVANHPVGGMDAMAFLKAIHRFFDDIISPANQLFRYIPNLHPVILEINVFAANTKETASKLNELYKSDTQVMIFPAGEVSRRRKGVITDPPWQKSFITKSVQFERDIIPVYISGRNSWLFYFIANLRKLLGIKMYIETVLLPREMMSQRNSSITLTFGKPISWKIFTEEKSHAEWAGYVKDYVYKITES